mgnify:FL=1
MSSSNTSQKISQSKFFILWPKASASIGVILASFLSNHPWKKDGGLTVINHPVLGSLVRETEYLTSPTTIKGKTRTLKREPYLPIISPIIDGFLTLIYLIRERRRFDICITAGIELGLIANFLKLFGITRKTAFVVMDYWPRRYESTLMNKLYYYIYSWCSKFSDFVIDVSPTINDARVRDGIQIDSKRLIYAPHPIEPASKSYPPQEKLLPDSMIWTGALTPECGFELVINAVEIVRKTKPGITVHITTYGEFPGHLQKAIEEKGVKDNFHFLGYIKDESEFQEAVQMCRIGLAPYAPGETTVKNTAGVGRPWTYMRNGVPPIITRVPADALEIEEAQAGIIIDYTKEDLANAILSLLSDDKMHENYRKKGVELSLSRSSVPVMTKLLSDLGFIVEDTETNIERNVEEP